MSVCWAAHDTLRAFLRRIILGYAVGYVTKNNTIFPVMADGLIVIYVYIYIRYV